MSEANIKGVIEALLFVSDKPLLLDEIKNVLSNLESSTIRQLIEELKTEYKDSHRGFLIVEVAGGFQMVTSEEYASFLKTFFKQRRAEKLSMPSLETLSIIAYKQPITRLEVEFIRGVNIDGVIKHLMDKRLIKIVGKKDVIGRPFLYGTTKEFLEYFGLQSLKDLPHLEEFKQLKDSLANMEAVDESKTITAENR